MTSEDNQRLWQNYQRDHWTKKWENSPSTIEEKIERVKNSRVKLPAIITYTPKNGKILEAGCGMGQWVVYLDDLGYDITGLDFSETVIKKLQTQYANLKFVVGDVTDFHFEDRSFDTILSWGVVEHFEKGPNKALSEAFRILKEEGVLIITVPCKNYLHLFFSPVLYVKERLRKNKIIRKIRKKKDLEVNFYQYEFRMSVFRKHILESGFEIIELKPISHQVGFVKSMNKLLQIRQNGGKLFHKNKTGKWGGLTKVGQFLCSGLKKTSSWFTPDQIFIVAVKRS